MRTSIATVCLSGGLDEKLEAIAAAGFRGVEIFENDLLSSSGSVADIARRAADLGLKIVTFQPFRDFEGMPEPQRVRTFDRAERKFDVMQQLGCELLMVCSNVAPDALPGVDRAAADFHELGERAAKRGMRIGFEALAWGRYHQRLPRFMGGRAPRQPSGRRARPRYFPYLLAQDRIEHVAFHSRRPHCAGAARRRALARHGRVVLEPAFPLLPGAGRLATGRIHGSVAGDRLQGRIVARDFQRPVPRRLAARGRHRRAALARLSDGPGPHKDRHGGRRFCAAAAALQMPRRRIHRVCRRRAHRRRVVAVAGRPRFRGGRHAQVKGRYALEAGRDQPGRQQGKGRLRPLAFHHARTVGLRDRPEGGQCRANARPRRAPARYAVPSEGGPGGTGNSGGARRRRQSHLFPR